MQPQSTRDAAKKIARRPQLMNTSGAAVVAFGVWRSAQVAISWLQFVSETSQSSLDGAYIEYSYAFGGADGRRIPPPIEKAHPPRSQVTGGGCIAVAGDERIG